MINILQHLDVWTSAVETRSTAGRGSSNKLNLYGIKKLRELILELAVRGQLVPQNPDDEPASVLLEKIATEKARLIKDGKLKKQEPLPPITDDEKPFELPNGWEWVRLGNVTNYGITDKAEASDVFDSTWVLELEDVEKETSHLLQKVFFKNRQFKSSKNRFLKDDVIYGKLRPYLDKVIVADESGVCTTEMIPMRSYCGYFPEFLRLLLKTPYFIRYATESTHGMNLPRLGTDKARLALVPIVSIAEQHRIVAKVNELMSLCDALEQEQAANIAAHQTLVEELLAALTQNEGNSWARIATHFDTLFTTEHSIDQLKQTILQLAVMGKLVPQDPNDEPASVLLQKIADEKARLIKAGKIKKEKPLPAITEDEKPFELPEGWEWCHIGDMSQLISGKGFKAEEYNTHGARLFQIANVSLGHTKWDVENYLPLTYLDDYPELMLHDGDILIALNRPLLNRYMKVCIISRKDLPAILYQRVGKFNFFYNELSKKYFYYYMQSGLFIDRLDEGLQGSDQPFINQSQVISFLFSLPPLTEQHRIVAKVDELMALCDAMKAQLKTAQTTQLQLADVLASQIIGAGDV